MPPMKIKIFKNVSLTTTQNTSFRKYILYMIYSIFKGKFFLITESKVQSKWRGKLCFMDQKTQFHTENFFPDYFILPKLSYKLNIISIKITRE